MAFLWKFVVHQLLPSATKANKENIRLWITNDTNTSRKANKKQFHFLSWALNCTSCAKILSYPLLPDKAILFFPPATTFITRLSSSVIWSVSFSSTDLVASSPSLTNPALLHAVFKIYSLSKSLFITVFIILSSSSSIPPTCVSRSKKSCEKDQNAPHNHRNGLEEKELQLARNCICASQCRWKAMISPTEQNH